VKFLDLIGVIGLFLIFPFILLVIIIVLIADGYPAIYSHKRIGKNSKIFQCYKIRTMKNNIDNMIKSDPKLFKEYVDNDYKIPKSFNPYTKTGFFLRKTNIDELPQLFNVLKGDMSIVGPRPIVDPEINHYTDEEKKILLSVKPGITGYWQVNGRNSIRYPKRKELELFYAKNQSFLLDINILIKTIIQIFKKDHSIT
tara:strand:+ start:16176 stop:16769 length:594 start_codon:yes stop_codon:yes gene_type:complete